MSVKYIRLNGDALRQIVENEKHCFRIAMNKQDILGGEMTEAGFLLDAKDVEEERKVIKPPYENGDILALKETWAMIDGKYVYRLDRDPPQGYLLFNWKPSVQMPNDAARNFIRITDVRVERLHDISLDDILRSLTVIILLRCLNTTCCQIVRSMSMYHYLTEGGEKIAK